MAMLPGYGFDLDLDGHSGEPVSPEAWYRYDPEYGLVARGARGARSRWRNALQPFRPLLLSWSQRGEMGTLNGADQVASPPPLAGEPLFCGIYANELMMRFLQRSDPHPVLFDRYRDLLGFLAAGESPQGPLRLFEKQLLESAGFGLQLAFEHGSRFYSYKGLRSFKAKFNPEWHAMYLAHRPRSPLPGILLDIAALIVAERPVFRTQHFRCQSLQRLHPRRVQPHILDQRLDLPRI